MLDRASTKPSAQSPRAAEKSSAALIAEHDKHITARDAAAAEFEQLKEGESAARRSGVDALREHRRKMEDAELRRDVAAQHAEDCARLRDEAIERDRNEVRLSAYIANQKEGEVWGDNVIKTYEDFCQKLQNLLTTGKEIQDRRERIINKDLPKGCAVLGHVEEKIRWMPAEPDREVEVEVEREIIPEGRLNSRGVGEQFPKRKVKERRIIKGRAAIRPFPLWESFQAAGLKPGDAGFRVQGVLIRALH